MKKILRFITLLILAVSMNSVYMGGVAFAVEGVPDGSAVPTGDTTSPAGTTTSPTGTTPENSAGNTDTGSNPSDCKYDQDMTVAEMIQGCKPSKGQISTEDENYKFNEGAKERVIRLINNIITVASLLAVGAIVYAGILYTVAAGDDERIKSAKNTLKFGIIGFIAMLLSFPIVNALVNLFYTTAG